MPGLFDTLQPDNSGGGILGGVSNFLHTMGENSSPAAQAMAMKQRQMQLQMQIMGATYNSLANQYGPNAAMIMATHPDLVGELFKPQVVAPGGELKAAMGLPIQGAQPSAQKTANPGGGVSFGTNPNGLIDDNTAAFYATRLNKGDDSFMKGGQFSGTLGAQNKAKVMNTAVQMAQGNNQSPLDISANTMNVEGLRKTMGNIYQTNNALNTGIQHVSQLFDAFQNLGNGNFQPTNYVKNLLGPLVGATGPVNYRAVVARVAPEITRIWRASNGAESDIERDLETLKNSLTPDQGAGALSNLAQLMESKINANQYQFESAWGPGTAKNFISPENQASLEKLRTLAQPQQAPNAAMPKVGEIRKGHKFLGGNPADPKSWQAIQQQTM